MRHLFTVLLVCVLFVLTARAQQVPKYDLLLKGGHVIDPANGRTARWTLLFRSVRSRQFIKDIPANEAGNVVDVTDLYVTPGLIDIHYHIGHGGAPLNWFPPDSADHEVLPPIAFTIPDPHSVVPVTGLN